MDLANDKAGRHKEDQDYEKDTWRLRTWNVRSIWGKDEKL